MSCLQHLSGFIGSQQVRLVTLSGGVGPYMTGIGQLDAACSVSIIPAPLRVSSAEVAEILRRESSVRDVILAATAADAAVVVIAPSISGATRPSCAPAISARANS